MKTKMRFILLSAAGLLLSAGVYYAGASFKTPFEEPAPKTESTTPRSLLIAGVELPPWEYTENGKTKGIDAEVVHRIMTKLNVSYKFELVPWPRALKMLEKGEADVCVSVSHKESRESFLYYTEEQKAFSTTGKIPKDHLWITEYVFFINKKYKKSLKFKSYKQIKTDGYRVGIQKDYAYNPEFWAANLELLHTVIEPEDGFQALIDGRIDVFPCYKSLGLVVLKKMGLSEKIIYLPKALFCKPYLLVPARNSDYPNLKEIMKKFYVELRKMRRSGEWQQIYDKYIK